MLEPVLVMWLRPRGLFGYILEKKRESAILYTRKKVQISRSKIFTDT
jgi:hypothetical protein